MTSQKWMKLDELRQPGMRRVLDALRSLDDGSLQEHTLDCFVIEKAQADAAGPQERRVQ
jgi:hypothetical protein